MQMWLEDCARRANGLASHASSSGRSMSASRKRIWAHRRRSGERLARFGGCGFDHRRALDRPQTEATEGESHSAQHSQ